MIPESKEDIIRRFAYNAYQIRTRCHLKGDATSDWMSGVQMYEDYLTLHDTIMKRKL